MRKNKSPIIISWLLIMIIIFALLYRDSEFAGTLFRVIVDDMYSEARGYSADSYGKDSRNNDLIIEPEDTRMLENEIDESTVDATLNDIDDDNQSCNETISDVSVSGEINNDNMDAVDIMQEDLEIEATTEQQSFDATEVFAGLVTSKGVTYSEEQLSNFDFLLSSIFTIDSQAEVKKDELINSSLSKYDNTVDLSGDEYKVLIYHTHGSEAFADSREGVVEDTIIGVGDYLTELLESYGVHTYHDRTVYDMVDGKLDRSYAYKLSSKGVDAILSENPSIEVVIDLHRDGVGEGKKLVTDINGKPTARIMFLNGISRSKKNGELTNIKNENRIANISFSLALFLAGRKISADFVRPIFIKPYRYNLEKRPKSTLIEAGAETNTIEEEKNAMILLAGMIFSVLSGKN